MLSLKQVMLDRLTQERSAVFYAIAFLPEGELTRRPLIGEWSAKDILGHLAAWEVEMTRSIQQFERGERPALLDICSLDDWNAPEASKRWDMALSDVKAELVSARAALLEVLGKLPDEMWTRLGPAPMNKAYVPQILDTIAEHDREHWAGLAEAKAKWVASQQLQVPQFHEPVMETKERGQRNPLLTR